MRNPDHWKPRRSERRVLLALLSGAANLSGYPLSRTAQVGSGRVYITLTRLEDWGWITARWDRLPGDPPDVDLDQYLPPPCPAGHNPDRGRRRFYRFTPHGRAKAMRLLELEGSPW